MVTVITKTIGSGKDYASFTLAEADVTNIGTSADLVANDEAIVFEADAATYSESVTFSSSLTTDATRNVTYKPAAGSEHNGDQSSGVIVQFNGNTIVVLDEFTVLEGLNLKSTSGSGYSVSLRADGSVARSCLLTTLWAGAFIYRAGTSTYPCVVENCVMYGDTHAVLALEDRAGLETYGLIVNCTAIEHSSRALQMSSTNATGTLNIECHNWLVLGGQAQLATGAGTTNLTGSGSNFGSSVNPWPVALQGTPATITPTTSFSTPLGSGDYAVYMGATGALADVTGNDVWQQGVGPSVNSDVPTTDINGVARSGATCNPGAFEADGFVAPTVLTRTIKPVGGDYASFTLAEADVTNIGGSADLTFENEAIVFEADAGTYSENVTFQSTLTTDATRNVTYKPAAGSEHGGDKTQGVIVTSSGFTLDIRDAHTHVRGLVAFSDQLYSALPREDGVLLADCIVEGTGVSTHAVLATDAGTASHPVRIENCVCRSANQSAVYIDATVATQVTIFNATGIVAGGGLPAFRVREAGGVATTSLTNCLSINSGTGGAFSPGVTAPSGSNNFGGATNPFPAAIQGSPYPITPTTNTSPGPGDWAIYDATNGALIDDPDNDVLAGGIGPDANPDVPTTDIIGNPRTGLTTEPGAFVLPPPVVEEDTWTPVMVRRNDPVDVYGVLTFGDAYINAVEDTLSVTGADGTDATPAIPIGTRALWIQLVSQTGAAAGETCDVSIEVSASQSLTLATLNGAGTAVGNVPGLMQFPVDCLGQNDPDTPVYPRVKIVTGSTVGASDVVTIRVVAICGQQTNTTWS